MVSKDNKKVLDLINDEEIEEESETITSNPIDESNKIEEEISEKALEKALENIEKKERENSAIVSNMRFF